MLILQSQKFFYNPVLSSLLQFLLISLKLNSINIPHYSSVNLYQNDIEHTFFTPQRE